MVSTTNRKLDVLQSDLLRRVPFVRHGVTGRVAGLGAADGNVGYGSPRDKADAWEMRQLFCASIDVDPHSLVTVGQIHGNDVRVVRASDAGKGATPESTHLGLADALITNEPGVTLMTLHADCLMILLVDPVSPAVGVVHAGWRGTVIDISGTTISAMRNEFGTKASDVRAFLGPAICGASNEVGPEV
ncbi:MAG: polyphenol oxidase family protein, partial [Thermomicrobiales bacterium]